MRLSARYVFVEDAGGAANIRRAPATACEPETAELMKDADVAAELREDAEECAVAKQALIAAESDAAVDRAVRKVKLLCYD